MDSGLNWCKKSIQKETKYEEIYCKVGGTNMMLLITLC